MLAEADERRPSGHHREGQTDGTRLDPADPLPSFPAAVEIDEGDLGNRRLPSGSFQHVTGIPDAERVSGLLGGEAHQVDQDKARCAGVSCPRARTIASRSSIVRISSSGGGAMRTARRTASPARRRRFRDRFMPVR
jgi:hypothetical protein